MFAPQAALKPGGGPADRRIGDHRLMDRLLALVAVILAGLALAPDVQAQAPTSFVRVPHSAGAVYVPIDGNGFPAIGAPAPVEPGRAPSPPAPRVYEAPRGAVADVGFLQLEIEPPTASVYVDGQPIGTAGEIAAPRLLALAPGVHRLEAALPGHRDLRIPVTVVRGRTRLIRAGLEPRDDDGMEGGYFVVPGGTGSP